METSRFLNSLSNLEYWDADTFIGDLD